jgi:DNA segregation ATPase FtsK/SpoIIIE-like protein
MKKKVIIKYLLDEAGRKKSLISGGDGKAVQTVEADLTPEAVELASIDYDGNALIDLTRQLSSKAALSKVGRPHIYETRNYFYFDEPQTTEKLVKFEKERVAKIAVQKEALKPSLEEALAEYEKEEIQRKEREAAQEKERAEHAAVIRAEKERLEKEKLDWIFKHGSEYLQRAVKLGYNCQRQYVTERAAKEFPGYALDFDNNANWKNRSCPSMAALDEVERLIQQGYDAKVVWLTEPAYEITDEEYYAEGPFEPCEAVAVIDYLGKYDLVKEI